MSEYKRKLIEVALPLDEINAACKADKDRKTGTIRNLHKWFAPMPLPAWRALLFAALVDDPEDEEKRSALLDLIRRLMKHGANPPHAADLVEAQRILDRQFPDGQPVVFDPFCGGGSTLVEAQRLGLTTRGSDLNPVPVLITRTLTETLPKVWDEQPLTQPTDSEGLFTQAKRNRYYGYDGLIQDVEHYARLVEQRAKQKLGHFYAVGGNEEVMSWLWARTADCPNPACRVETVLTTSWWLSKKAGDKAWISPRVVNRRIELDVLTGQRSGAAPESPKVGHGATFACLACGGLIKDVDLHNQVEQQGALGLRLTAVAVKVAGRKTFRAPTQRDLDVLKRTPRDPSVADVPLADDPRSIWCVPYGVRTQADLYTSRQLLALTTFADLVSEVMDEVRSDGGSEDWARAVATLLGIGVGKLAHYGSTQTRMSIAATTTRTQAAFGRNDIPMTWDFSEVNPFGGRSGGWLQYLDTSLKALAHAPHGDGTAGLADAREAKAGRPALVATDPPYFDAIGYADLSDYFYVWHRRALRSVHPDLYRTIAAPRAGELTAVPSHHGGKDEAKQYFIDGFTETFQSLAGELGHNLPMLVVYASKEQKSGKDEETRWSSILTAMLAADLEITGAWPIHGTGGTRMISQGANAVATYVAMVARPRGKDATTCSLGEFNRVLRRELPGAVHALQEASILPVDMAQAVMGPGMSIFSRYVAVIDQEGRTLGVQEALRLINNVYAEVQEEQEGYLDADSQFAVAWWHKHGWASGTFGEADALARPKGISVDDVARAGVIAQQPNKVTALGNSGLDRDWDPTSDIRATSWEAVHHLVDRLIDGGGQTEAARLLSKVDEVGLADSARMLTYRLAAISASTQRTKDEERYNALIEAWPRLMSNAPTEGLF